ncbi:mitochondrial dicarboxylate carrier [Drosophila rhopaloa]|uniref:Mitochondrial dicarboxylate carrier n=1 Tax=Drosophila rhopaloa TaxID=1041015 RepID=A0ABM5HLR1_DRORH|nr:mitochondrial dicarboxylate carrier [Drosophila rhopaloa]XP_044313892.1 mitochondrial dicarboxylate carrier [Drosophila rhopaloa]
MPVLDDNIIDECEDAREGRLPRWWFGGFSSVCVAFAVAPIDIVKTHMQIQKKKRSIYATALNIHKLRGFLGFYDGFSAAILRQITSTNIRFIVYEAGKKMHLVDENAYLGKIILGCAAGLCGSVCGVPTDLINVRMQTDMKDEPNKRRNYKHVFDGFVRIPREEGWMTLYKGGSVAVLKASLGTCSQIALYDIIKTEVRKNTSVNDGVPLHFLTSLATSIISSTITHPLDVVKTLMMNSRPGEFSTTFHAAIYMMRFGVTGPYRGLVPAVVRKAPATTLLFVLYEQLRLHFGICSLGGDKING